MAEEQKQELKYFVRISNTDLDGNKSVQNALTKIKGISFMFSNAILKTAMIEKTKKIGYLSDEQVSRIKQVLDELNIKQVIVVSHEPRIESFVDSVIRIKKDNHVSYVA